MSLRRTFSPVSVLHVFSSSTCTHGASSHSVSLGVFGDILSTDLRNMKLIPLIWYGGIVFSPSNDYFCYYNYLLLSQEVLLFSDLLIFYGSFFWRTYCKFKRLTMTCLYRA
jgi:hypothetical protein